MPVAHNPACRSEPPRANAFVHRAAERDAACGAPYTMAEPPAVALIDAVRADADDAGDTPHRAHAVPVDEEGEFVPSERVQHWMLAATVPPVVRYALHLWAPLLGIEEARVHLTVPYVGILANCAVTDRRLAQLSSALTESAGRLVQVRALRDVPASERETVWRQCVRL